ncbi:MAG: anhydro-N-acetylmuramic acid kinase [Phycisphaerae bacterium]|jgi:1,6-anhydro-N-acetylmuramate kinase
MRTRFVVGCMSGTSIDAVDAACMRIDGDGLDMRAACLAFSSRPLGEIAEPLRALAEQRPMTAGQLASLLHGFSRRHVEAVHAVLTAAGRPRADLIAVHGQTVFHRPPLSMQLVVPTLIAHEFACEVAFDLRAADLAAGGQGAPITPLADYVLYRSAAEGRVMLNLGGFCNYTWLPACGTSVGKDERRAGAGPVDAFRATRAEALDRVRAGDICICNQLLDALARRLLRAPYDEAGRTAARGQSVAGLERELTERLIAQARAERSLGTGDELSNWIDRACAGAFRPADVLRSACCAISAAVADRLIADARAFPETPRAGDALRRVLVAGGGVRNRTLLGELRARLPWPVEAADAYGPDATAREAAAMAVLAALAQDDVPITLSQVTRRGESRLAAGAWIRPRRSG